MDPWSLYIYAMNAPITREKYEISLGKVLDFIGIDVEDGNRSFVYTMASSGIFSNIAIRLSNIF